MGSQIELTESNFIPSLMDIRIELLRGCPLACTHCSAFASPSHSLELSPERVLALLGEFANLGGHRVTFTGGEPLIYLQLPKILHRCYDYGLHVRLFSSGIIFSKGLRYAVEQTTLEQLSPYLDAIDYSLYAARPDFHDSVTGFHGSHSLTVEAIRRTITVGINATIHFVPTQKNYRDLPALFELATQLGVQQVSILRFVPHGRGRARANQLTLDHQAHEWLRDTIIDLQGSTSRVKLHVGSAYNHLGHQDVKPCTSAIDQLVVMANGTIAPCSAFGNFFVDDDFGNVLEHPLHIVWKHSAFLQQVREALRIGGNCRGCLAQKAISSGRIDPFIEDNL